jgi:copper(I)-binding protein
VRKRVLFVVVALACVAGVILFAAPIFQASVDDQTDFSAAPELGSTVQLSDARFVLPPRAGQPASLFFDISNAGSRSIQLVDVTVADNRAVMISKEGPAPQQIASVEISPGETLTFGPYTESLIFSEYDSSIVPGADVRAELTFGNAEKITVSAPVSIEDAVTSSE